MITTMRERCGISDAIRRLLPRSTIEFVNHSNMPKSRNFLSGWLSKCARTRLSFLPRLSDQFRT